MLSVQHMGRPCKNFITIHGITYYGDKQAIIIGYTNKCTFNISTLKLHEEAAVAIGNNNEIFIVRESSSWHVMDHVGIEDVIKSYFKQNGASNDI